MVVNVPRYSTGSLVVCSSWLDELSGRRRYLAVVAMIRDGDLLFRHVEYYLGDVVVGVLGYVSAVTFDDFLRKYKNRRIGCESIQVTQLHEVTAAQVCCLNN